MVGFFGNDEAEAGGPKRLTSGMGESVKHFLRKTFGGGLKGALIGAIALPVIAGAAVIAGVSSIPFALPLLAAGTTLSGTLQGFLATQAVGLAINGALAGAGIGSGIGAITGISGAGEAAEDAENTAQMKARRQYQLARNQEIIGMNGQRMASMPPTMPISVNPNMGLPQQGQGMERTV